MAKGITFAPATSSFEESPVAEGDVSASYQLFQEPSVAKATLLYQQ